MSAQRKATGSSHNGGRRAQKGPTSRKATTSSRSWPRRLLRWALLAGLGFFLLGCAAFAYGYVSTDIPDPNKDFEAQTTLVYYKDGEHVLGKFATQNRTSIPLADVPQHVQDAVVAAEDRSFYTNKGIDPKGILRAAFSNASGGSTQGASTITQQYVKIFYLSSERTMTRKVKEAFLSLKLQRQQSKQQILQGYLNTIYFGRGAYGVQAAAQAYFNKDAKDLTVREGAVIASVLNSPENFDPADGPEVRQRLLGRYQYVLHGMASMGAIPKDVADKAAERLPHFPKVSQTSDQYGGQKGYMLELVKAELRSKGFSDAEIEGGGLRVTTTFTRKAMNAAAAAVREQAPKGLKQLHVGVASTDPRTGALRGFYAGQDYLKSNGATNWAKTGGLPGSTFKPFALAAGLVDGFSLKSTFNGDSPYTYPNGKDTVVNEGPGDGNDYGPAVSLTKATEESINTAFMDLTASMEHGPKKIMDTAIDMGIPEDAPGLAAESGISLGSASVSPITMANAYGTIADGGKAKDVYVVSSVETASGGNAYKKKVKPERAIPYDVDRDLSYALQQVVKNGTGKNALALGRPAAGKTGTATDNNGHVQSSWFVGYTPQLSTAVWFSRGDGNDPLDGYLPSYFGAEYPTKTWTAVMERALEGTPVVDFPPPANLEQTNDVEGHDPVTPTPTPTPTRTKKPTEEPSPSPTEFPSPTEPTQPTEQPTPTDPGTICFPRCNQSDTASPTGNGNGNGFGNSPSP